MNTAKKIQADCSLLHPAPKCWHLGAGGDHCCGLFFSPEEAIRWSTYFNEGGVPSSWCAGRAMCHNGHVVREASFWLHHFSVQPGLCGTFINNYPAGALGVGSLLQMDPAGTKRDGKTKPKPRPKACLISAGKLPTEPSSKRSSLFMQGSNLPELTGHGISIPSGSPATSRGRRKYLAP